MTEPRLFIGILGKSNSGKSSTWYDLFSRRVKTGEKNLELYHKMWEEVFLVNGSPEETYTSLKDRLESKPPRILLCSLQYVSRVEESLDFIFKHKYEMHFLWLNPGYREKVPYKDELNFSQLLLRKGASLKMIDANSTLEQRSKIIRSIVHGWSVANL